MYMYMYMYMSWHATKDLQPTALVLNQGWAPCALLLYYCLFI